MSASMLGSCCCVNGIFKGILISRVKGNVKWLFLNDKQAGRMISSLSKPISRVQRHTALLNLWQRLKWHSRTDG